MSSEGPARKGERFLELVEVMDRLRSPGGCPWDAEQTHASLVKYLLEEAYETAEAIEDADGQALREELGDVLLQVVFHARIAEEAGTVAWDIDDVAAGIIDKLVSRHPHVFAGASVDTARDVEANWEALKAAEKGRTSATDGVPLAQPALALASALVGRAAKAGLDVPVAVDVRLDESAADSESIGELLMAVVALARRHGVDPEGALRAAARDYRRRVLEAEQV
ncbi:MAG TPA: MazG family protein [Acidothermaceae bacterium]|nr:MazG family protein [Acidothermaceae bacterium]